MTAVDGQPAFVQLPHPGVEHRPTADVMGWNCGAHRRKFLLADAHRHDGDRLVGTGPVTFWGEWEPPSRIVDRRPATIGSGLPAVLHEPLRPRWQGTEWRQNTDPLVFGSFGYSNCRQAQNGKLRRLPPGSVICFGSRLQSRFVLDTVLVVADGVDYDQAGLPRGASALQKASVFDPLYSDPDLAGAGFRHYRGATADDPVNGTFSFVPARPYDPDDWAFPRPALPLDPSLITPTLAQAAKVTPLPHRQLRDIWRSIVDTVLDAGLLLATAIEPPRKPGPKEGADGRGAAGHC